MMICAILLLKEYTRSLTADVVSCCCCLPDPYDLSETVAVRELSTRPSYLSGTQGTCKQ